MVGLSWAGFAYSWGNPHVVIPISLGAVLLLGFALYEWKGRSDGLISHAFFQRDTNFAYSIFAFGAEGWIYYGAVNPEVPKIILNLGWEMNSYAYFQARQPRFLRSHHMLRDKGQRLEVAPPS